jgi:hypothetical protein
MIIINFLLLDARKLPIVCSKEVKPMEAGNLIDLFTSLDPVWQVLLAGVFTC